MTHLRSLLARLKALLAALLDEAEREFDRAANLKDPK